MESLLGLRYLVFQALGDDSLRDGLLPGIYHGLLVGLVQSVWIGGQAGAEQRVKKFWLNVRYGNGRSRDLGRGYPCRSPTAGLAELIGQRRQRNGARVPAALIREIGNVLLVGILFQVAQAALEVEGQSRGKRFMLAG